MSQKKRTEEMTLVVSDRHRANVRMRRNVLKLNCRRTEPNAQQADEG